MAYPADYKYTKEHEWLKIDGNTGVIGITDYAQNSLGDIVFVELPKVGAEISIGKTFGSVESVKAVSDLFAPVSGTVTEVDNIYFVQFRVLLTAPALLVTVTVYFPLSLTPGEVIIKDAPVWPLIVAPFFFH